MGNRTCSPEFKIQVVLEGLQSDGIDAKVARAYDIHPVTLSNWKKRLKENGSKAFGGGDELKEKKDKIAKLKSGIPGRPQFRGCKGLLTESPKGGRFELGTRPSQVAVRDGRASVNERHRGCDDRPHTPA